MSLTLYKILVRSPNWLGDCVLALPAIRELKKHRPNAHIAVLAKASVAGLWELCPDVDEVIPFTCRKGLKGLIDRWHLAQQLKAQKFNAALIIPNSFDSALVPFLARIKKRFGWATAGRRPLLNRRVPFPHHLDGEQQPHCQLYLVEKWLGHPVDHTLEAELKIPEDALKFQADNFKEPYFAICPGASYGTAKCWLPENYAETALQIRREYKADCCLLGGKGDTAVCEEILKLLKEKDFCAEGWCHDLSGKTSIAELAATLKGARALITNDTGTMHVAAATKTPIVAIFGPTNWLRTAPLGQNNILLRGEHDCNKKCRRVCLSDHRCMKAVSVEMVTDALKKLVQ